MPGRAHTAIAAALIGAAVAACSATTPPTSPQASSPASPPATSAVAPPPEPAPPPDGPFATQLREISVATGIPEPELLRDWYVMVRLEVPLPWAIARRAPSPVIPAEAAQLAGFAERDDGYAYWVFDSPGADLARRLAADSDLPADERLVILGYSVPAGAFATLEDQLTASGLVAGWEILGTPSTTFAKPTGQIYTADVVARFAEHYEALGMGG